MKKNVYVFTKYQKKGASSRVRFYEYLPFFSDSICFEYSALFDDKYLDSLYSGKGISILRVFYLYLTRFVKLLKVVFFSKYNVVWIEKELFPYLPIPFEVMFTMAGKRVVYDYDDAVFHNYDKPLIKNIFRWKFSVLAKYSDLVFAGNKYLAENLSDFGAKNVQIIPTVIDWSRYQNIFSRSKLDERSHDRSIVLVWIGTPSTEKYLSIIDEPLTRLQRQYNIDLHVIGSSDSLNLICQHTKKKWTKEQEVELLNNGDIGIMPLFDSKFEKGKCGYKIIQYFALSKPVCASPVGINKDLIQSNENGYLCKTSEEWFRAIEKLVTDIDWRLKLGRNGMKLISKRYAYHIQAPRIEKFIIGLE